MLLNTYLLYQRVILTIHYVIYPLGVVLYPILSFVRKRKDFESARTILSFKDSGKVASHCFHVSSEGELEQALPLITFFLDKGNFIELVYTSDSVTRKCEDLAENYKNLNLLRMPLLSFPRISFRRWVTAKKLFMCRYDFFSELILYGARRDIEFTLLSASLKGKSLTGVKSIFLRDLYRCFNVIVAASNTEKEKFLTLDPSLNVSSFEFRLLQISSRLSKAEEKLSQKSELKNFFNIIKERSPSTNLIIGSAWPAEMDIFKDQSLIEKIQNGELLVTIAPHSLSKNSIDSLVEVLKEIAPSLSIINACDATEFDKGEVFLNSTPGVLLESYLYFGHVLVGGGHGRSIHSVLEPFLAGARVYCGPKIFRSTEFDFIKTQAPSDVIVVEDLEKISSSIVEYNRELEIEKRKNLVSFYNDHFNEMMECF